MASKAFLNSILLVVLIPAVTCRQCFDGYVLDDNVDPSESSRVNKCQTKVGSDCYKVRAERNGDFVGSSYGCGSANLGASLARLNIVTQGELDVSMPKAGHCNKDSTKDGGNKITVKVCLCDDGDFCNGASYVKATAWITALIAAAMLNKWIITH